ncbi:hypothetical protein Agub_g13340 [Astrephomene gubernaculifera]|uniref:J domain-containing protein n=1 Tax=Astrephomene gubernaculifera TaxID=47775 RepID=A0AAD3E032_9CHLO|nr:hypothetical protein Agub_g13340 [Astrephomene gubernaculifera]
MLGVVIKCIRSSSSLQSAAPLVCIARAALGFAGSRKLGTKGYQSAADATPPTVSLQALLDRGVSVSVLPFEISAAEAVRRFEEYQRESCMYLHAPSLLNAASTHDNIVPGEAHANRADPGQQNPSGKAGGTASSNNNSNSDANSGGSSSSSSSSGPSGRPDNGSSVVASYLPFWCFDATFSSEARAKLGFKDESTREVVWKDMSDPLPLSTRALASHQQLPALQVYAAYSHLRDVGAGATGAGLPARARPLSAAEAAAGAVGGVELAGAAMRQGLAWQLAVRGLTQQQLGEAEVAVRGATRATDLKDVHVSLRFHSRSCRLVFLPAYIATYTCGHRYKRGTSGVIVPQWFTAAIGGTREGRVVAPQHVSPAKASLGGGGLVGGLGLLAGGGLPLPLGLGLESLLPQLGAVEALTMAALAASGAGMWASSRTASLRAHHAAEQARADYEFYKKYDIHETYGSAAAAAAAAAGADPNNPSAGGGPASGAAGGAGSVVEEYMLWLWSDADWRRWEHDEPWNWDEEERRKWAEELWRKHALRRLQRQRHSQRMAAEAARRAAEEQAEARRERMYGSSSRSSAHRPRDHGVGGGEEEEELFAGGGRQQRRRRRSDFLGYYRALGLQDAEAVSTDDIKQAFKTQALLLHPDKHVSADEESRRTTLVKFQKLQIAYDTLKDAEKRRLYDRGQFVP